MPKRCGCLDAQTKQDVLSLTDDGRLRTAIESIPVCGAKRPRTAYQSFVSTCMKGKGIHSREDAQQAIRACAAEWRSRK